MADFQVGPLGVPAFASRTRVSSTDVVDNDNMDSIAAMRTRLAAINAGLYTAAYLNTMTVNDMVYAIRLNDNAGTI